LGGCGCEVVELQPAELLNEAMEGNEDLIPIPLNTEKLVVWVGGLGIEWEVVGPSLVGMGGASSISGRGSLFTRRERGINFPFPPVALADNCRQIPPPNPVRLAKGSSSNKKSGGGELRGEDSWVKGEIES
jgi:hypothetical protein